MILTNADLLAIERELCKRSLFEFAKRAWPVLEPGREFKDNWHIGFICTHLEAVSRGEIPRLLINVPPRHMKSLLVSVIWPVWDWITTPTRQFLTASYVQKLSTRDALKSRQLIQSSWFQSLFGHIFTLGTDQNEKQRYQNDKRGHRIAISTSGGVGEGGDILIADDPQNTDEMSSDPYIESTTDWWNCTFNQRLNDQNDGAIVLTMQRLSERDLCEVAIKEGGWVHLMIPAEFEQERKCVTPWGEDPRTKEGELLWPNRIGAAAIVGMKKRLGIYGTAGQLQQRPAPKGGGMFKKSWFRVVRAIPAGTEFVRGWDLASTEGGGDWTVGIKIGRQRDGRFIVVDRVKDQLSAAGVEKLILNTASQDGYDCTISIPQDPGQAGKAQAAYLVKQLAGYNIKTSTETGEKKKRAEPFASQVEVGNVDILEGDWVEEYLEIMAAFPNARNDDEVDATSRAFNEIFMEDKFDLEAMT